MEYFNTYKDYLTTVYGKAVYRIGVDAGFSCPNRENRRGGCVFCDGLGSSATYARAKESFYKRNSDFVSAPPQNDSLYADPLMQSRLDAIKEQIKRGAKFIKERYNSQALSLYFQAYSNTYDSIENLKTIYDYSLSLEDFYEFIVSTRPDCLEEEKLDLLETYKTKVKDVWVEIGLQSGSDKILKLMNRGCTADQYLDSAKRVHQRGLKLSSHVIIGFPGETKEDLDQTIRLVNEAPLTAIKIHNTHFTAQTQLLDSFYEGEMTAASEERHVQDLIYFLRRIKPSLIIQRVICETPNHRLAAPRGFCDKNSFLIMLREKMQKLGAVQGDLCKE